ncbi:hypothetical protein [Pyxidicoccus trucidator]|uniref:hypothetical protein n=1 Tax=Pyxidicoccus trucidator TaxID=2709662 RepID=UPI0013DC37A7|nr:hypothetical protein [Pyxidicoccus trucidator]
MKHSFAVLVAFLSLSLLGCGGAATETEAGAAPEMGEQATVSQFATCTALCNGGQSVSCSGTTCSSTNYQGVTCNGVFTACPATCSGLPTCTSLAGTSCSVEGAEQQCCSGGATGLLTCGRNSFSPKLRWLY